MDKIEPGRIKLELEDFYTEISIKQIIALETGNILITNDEPITNPSLDRLSKLLYIRDLFAGEYVKLHEDIFKFISDEEIDSLINILENNIKHLNIKKRSKFSTFLWQFQNFQLGYVYDYYRDINTWDFSIINKINRDELLVDRYLKYLEIDNNCFNYLESNKRRLYILKKLSSFGLISDKIIFNLDLDLLSTIEAIRFKYGRDNENIRFFGSILKYCLLSIYETDKYNINIFSSAYNFKPRLYYSCKLSRADRRKILEELDKLDIEVASKSLKVNNKAKYIRVLEKLLHPKDYKKLFPHAYLLFNSFKKTKQHKPIFANWVSNLYRENTDIIKIASLVYENYILDFIYRFDSFARRAEKEGKESYLLEMLIDAKLDKICLETLNNFYNKRIKKLQASYTTKTDNNVYFAKPMANLDFVNCVLDIINLKLKEYE